jgi:general stress protein YciG
MSNKKQNLTDQEREAFALVGRHGGRATFKKMGKKHMSEIGKQGAKKRWGIKEEIKK